MQQDDLRINTKLAKALNSEYTYKIFADYLEITANAFYNWLQGYYSLSRDKANKLNDIVVDLIDY